MKQTKSNYIVGTSNGESIQALIDEASAEQNQFTPGPWHVQDVVGKTANVRGAPGPFSNGRIIAKTWSVAEATLIAAAPEMLVALERLLQNDRLMNAMSREEAQGVLHAIQKAKGAK